MTTKQKQLVQSKYVTMVTTEAAKLVNTVNQLDNDQAINYISNIARQIALYEAEYLPEHQQTFINFFLEQRNESS